ncbi:hypothetical protein [Tessaracoccus caeni]|uniref:hypothetical protein n=1 Tax=Tessaracoccus caeni TaxID=3031239 RepID=UPI0023DBFC76|nr:hypothetical protein [Tessaracoccus caeni]MDF1487917.1 hypothetical protein [Tessaracoccus caeni]
MVSVQGATLAGMAAAARLARLGHPVTVHTCGEPLGGRWAPAGDAESSLPPLIILPAAWRDLFKKTGRALDPELARRGLRFAPAPPVRHLFDDGTSLDLPSERGAQFYALAERYGTSVAERWRDLLDGADDAWTAARRFGVESPASPASPAHRRSLWLDRTLADLADRVDEPHLARILLDLRFPAGTASTAAPGLLATRLAVERQFGRWQLVDGDGHARPSSLLLELLIERLSARGVQIVDEPAESPDIDCLPHRPRTAWWRLRVPLAQAPLIGYAALDPASSVDSLHHETSQTIDHTSSQVVISWRVPHPDGARQLTWDYRSTRRDLAWGLEPRRAREILARPAIDDHGSLRASVCSPAGPEPWAELSSAALAVYELHERLTGQDCRPTNRDFRLPPVPRPRRALGASEK